MAAGLDLKGRGHPPRRDTPGCCRLVSHRNLPQFQSQTIRNRGEGYSRECPFLPRTAASRPWRIVPRLLHVQCSWKRICSNLFQFTVGFRETVLPPDSGTAIVTIKAFSKKEVWVITGDEIRRLRGKESQAEFAHRLGVSASTVCRWEASGTRPSPLALRSLLKLRKRAAALSTAEKM